MPFSLRMRARSLRWAARTSGVAGVGVAPAQVAVQRPGLDGVVGVLGVGEGELFVPPIRTVAALNPTRLALADLAWSRFRSTTY